jgi:uncharacterized protein YjiS (DUF1127 family)
MVEHPMLENSSPEFWNRILWNRIHRLHNPGFGGDVLHGRHAPRTAPAAVCLAGSERSAAVAFSLPDPNRRILSLAAAARWICARWRREREIRRAVDALAKLDDGTLRDIGIADRSQIDPVVRYCRDC